MAFFENCVERATALAATCGWLAFGGGLEAAVGVAVGGAGLATVVSDAMRRHGPESEKSLAAIRVRVREGLERYASAENWYVRADLEAADQAMDRALAASFLDRRSLAESARSPEGFPAAATEIILCKLAESEPAIFGENGSYTANDYAATVIKTALEAAIENESYFKNLQPHLMMEALRGIGSIESKVDAVHSDVLAIQSALNRVTSQLVLASNARDFEKKSTIQLVANDQGKVMLFHSRPFPYPLDRLEYSKSSRRLMLVVDGGFKRDFGVSVHSEFDKLLTPEAVRRMLVVLMDHNTGEPLEGDYYPLRFTD